MGKLAIGSASFGNKYGIMNNNVFKNESEIKEIISYCSQNGIIIDTSPGYGNSFSIISNLSKCLSTQLAITTKVITNNENIDDYCYRFKKELTYVSHCDIRSVLFHEANIASKNNFKEYYKLSNHILKEFSLNKIGFSIYDPEDIDKDIKHITKDIQIPYNIYDKRFESYLDYKKTDRVYCRSIFLQGLLTSEAINSGVSKKYLKASQEELKDLSSSFNIPIEVIAISYVLQKKSIDYVLVGVNSINQFYKLIENFNKAKEIIKNDSYLKLLSTLNSDNLLIDCRSIK